MEENIKVLVKEEDIYKRADEMAAQIDKDYAGRTVHMIGVLNGGVFFMCELAKRITIPVTFDFLAISSYGNATESSGNVIIKKNLDQNIEGRDVIVVDDIVDSGRSLNLVHKMLLERHPASLRMVTLLDKPERRVVDVDMYMTGFTIPNEFVVGFGLDYAAKYRNLPYVGVVDESTL